MGRKLKLKWRGFDYVGQKEVTLYRKEWRALIEQGSTSRMSDGSLLIYDKDHHLVAEVYDKE